VFANVLKVILVDVFALTGIATLPASPIKVRVD
jgi:hypothetical protein